MLFIHDLTNFVPYFREYANFKFVILIRILKKRLSKQHLWKTVKT